MVDFVAVSRNSERFLRQKSKEDPAIADLVSDFLGDTKNLIKVGDNMFLYSPLTERGLQQYQELIRGEFGEDSANISISFRLKKGQVVYHSELYSRKGGSCSYLVQYNTDCGTSSYGKICCFILKHNQAFCIIRQYNLKGTTVCTSLDPPSDEFLKAVMESQLVGQEFMAVDITKNYKIIKCDRLEHKYLYIDSENEHIGYMCMYIDT